MIQRFNAHQRAQSSEAAGEDAPTDNVDQTPSESLEQDSEQTTEKTQSIYLEDDTSLCTFDEIKA